MSQKRRNAIFDRVGKRKASIATLTHDYAPAQVIPMHFHERDQLVYGSRGVMTVRTSEGTRVVPTDRAVWIPAGIPHTITMSGTVAQLCNFAGAGKRTIERLFQEDVGMTFGRWRQQLRLMHAMRLLAEGTKISHAAIESGYRTPSAFISMFRRALGTTPKSYFKADVR